MTLHHDPWIRILTERFSKKAILVSTKLADVGYMQTLYITRTLPFYVHDGCQSPIGGFVLVVRWTQKWTSNIHYNTLCSWLYECKRAI